MTGTPSSLPSSTVQSGTVAAFDRHIGLGDIRTDDDRTIPFHCIAIADGTRTIEVGTRVRFAPSLRFGRLEATAVTPE